MKDISLQDLLEAGSHFGHQKRRWNPKMKRFIYGERDGVHVFDLVKTKAGLDNAGEFLAGLVRGGGVALFVGTKRQAADIVVETAKRVNMPYVSVRWMGGFLTNWSQLVKSLNKLADYKQKRESGEFKKYTKLEQLLLDREIARLNKFFGGVAGLTKVPDALFVVDTHREEVAVLEAVRMGIPVVGIVDSNADPDIVTHPIPANDDAIKSIELIVTAIGDAIASGQTVEVKAPEKKKKQSKMEPETVVLPEEIKAEAEVIEEVLVKEEEKEKNKVATKKVRGEK